MGGRDAEGRAPQGIAEALVSTEPTIKQQASALLSAYAGAHSRYDAMEGNGGTAGRLAEAEARVLEVLERGLAQDDERSVELAALRERVRTLEEEREAVAWAYMDMLSALYPGYDRQAIDGVLKAMQDRYGSPAAQVQTALRRARLNRAP